MSEDSAAEAFLRDNPEFLNDWLSKHGTAEHLQRVARRLEENDSGSKSELSLPLPSFSQVARNSITSSIFKKYLKGDRNRKTSVRKDRNSLCQMSEEELFMELIRDIASELDVNVLCHKILQNVSILTNSDRGSLFLVRGSRESRYLVSKLFDVTNISTLEESIHTEENEIKVPFGKGIAGHVAQTKEIININNAYEVRLRPVAVAYHYLTISYTLLSFRSYSSYNIPTYIFTSHLSLLTPFLSLFLYFIFFLYHFLPLFPSLTLPALEF